MNEIEQECVRRIAEVKDLSPEQVTLDSTLESLGVDSLDRVSLSFDLEEQYGVEIPESALHNIQTVGDVSKAVEAALRAKGANQETPKAGEV